MTAAPLLSSRRTRTWSIAGATLLAALTLGACQITSPVTTDLSYDAADGVSVDAGDVLVRDLAVVSEGSGAPGTLIGLAVNQGQEPVTLTLTVEAQALETTVEVPAGGAARLDGEALVGGQAGTAVTVSAVTPPAGATVPVKISTSVGGVGSAVVPVLAPIGPYSDLADDAAATSGR